MGSADCWWFCEPNERIFAYRLSPSLVFAISPIVLVTRGDCCCGDCGRGDCCCGSLTSAFADGVSSSKLERAMAPSVEVGAGETCALVRVRGDAVPSEAAAVNDAVELCDCVRLSRAESFDLILTSERAIR